jgi:hypothetical protein
VCAVRGWRPVETVCVTCKTPLTLREMMLVSVSMSDTGFREI